MTNKARKYKTILYPAAFILIAVISLLYKFVLTGNAGTVIKTVRSSEVVSEASESEERTRANVDSSAREGGSEASGTTMASAGESSDSLTPSGDSDKPEYKLLQVYICGAVNKPGVYNVAAGTILNDALTLAGGLTSEAAATSVNLVYVINSNMSFYIPTAKELRDGSGISDNSGVIRDDKTYIWGQSVAESGMVQDSSAQGGAVPDKKSKININTATEDQLKSLPGIGEVTAKSIVEYRTSHPFKSISDLKKVSGIGDSKYEKVKDYITVS